MSRKSSHTGLKVFLILLILCFIAATAFLIRLSLNLPGPEEAPASQTTPPAAETTLPPRTQPATEPTQPQPETVIATATVSAQGDLLMHKPLFDSRSKIHQEDGSYDFSHIFKYFAPTLQSYDYAIANLETTFGGDDFPYQGNPAFNCPDPFLPSVVEAGYDMLLTANNHSYDTQMTGLTRTLETVRAAGLQTLGTRLTEEEPRYSLVEVNGIRLGMICYSYTSGLSQDGRPRMNGNMPVENPELINWFYNREPERMYGEVEQILVQMEQQAVDATMLFIHWGNEYELTENGFQNQQAQALCDLGIDVIVGGHPHVVQPVEVLTSNTDPEHNTICIYSLGNAVSNQRHGNIPMCSTAHTEDGILFEITFEKYSDGNVYIRWADILPTWVNLHWSEGGNEYNMIPLHIEERDQWQTQFGFSDEALRKAGASYDRTMKIVGEGLQQIQDFLTAQKEAREQHYLELAGLG